MQLDGLSKRLEGLSDASVKGYPIRNLYRLMYVPPLWLEAYSNVYSNKGAITLGVDDDTLDGMSQRRIDQIINDLKAETYRCKPVRRVYIPKGNSKLRPLGIPSGSDKLVQEVAKTLLERIYEPIFSDDSHGFRPHRSCHTALENVQKTWTGVKWFIEFDIKGFFDNLDHEIMIELLEKKIDDKRFIKLIKTMLKAGCLDDWKYHETYSGTPQGGIISPILSNIYLHELDCFVEKLAKEFNRGKTRPPHPQHRKFTYQIHNLRKKIDQYGLNPILKSTLKDLQRQQQELPSRDQFSPMFKRLRYCRYADDFIVGVIGSKDEAEYIMQKVTQYLNQVLKLEISDQKTRIEHASKGVQFLGYHISTLKDQKRLRTKVHGRYVTKRVINGTIKLRVPLEKISRFCNKNEYGDWSSSKPRHRNSLLNGLDEEIILTYNLELRGFANYYSLACDVKQKLSKLEYLAHYSLFKTLAYKHKCRMAKILSNLRERSEFMYRYTLKGESREIKVFKLKHLMTKPKTWEVDEIPHTFWLTSDRSELLRRMKAETCEYCGKESTDIEVHHTRRLKDLLKKPHLEKWEKVMIARQRRTIILCMECHNLLHAGTLPDNRYKPRKV